jgi:hypothetical protein
MHTHPATTKIIKAGRSKWPFLLFFGSRKSHENELANPVSSVLAALLLILVAAVLGFCFYAFLTGKLR